MIIGIDHGYAYTKTSKGVIFPSRIREYDGMDIGENKIVEIDGKTYIVGEKGQYTTDTNKINSEENKVCTFTALALSTISSIEDFQVVAGLPVSLYSKQKNEFREKLLSYGLKTIKINGVEKHIHIQDAIIFPQGAGPVFLDSKYKDANVLVIDWGGLTVDVCYFEKLNLTQYSTYQKGMLTLYGTLAQKIYNKFELPILPIDVEEKLKHGLKVYGEKQDLSFLDNDIDKFTNEIITYIQTEYLVRDADYILLVGGGSMFLYDRIKKYFKNGELVDNAQFANAVAFEQIGRMKF